MDGHCAAGGRHPGRRRRRTFVLRRRTGLVEPQRDCLKLRQTRNRSTDDDGVGPLIDNQLDVSGGDLQQDVAQKEELLTEAESAGIDGAASMTKEELADALASRMAS